MLYGNLFVDNYERVGGDMDICGNLTIGGDLQAKSYYANKRNFYLDNYLLIPYGTIIQSAAVTVPDGFSCPFLLPFYYSSFLFSFIFPFCHSSLLVYYILYSCNILYTSI